MAITSREIRYPSSDGKSTIYARIWKSNTVSPKFILQIAHGMCEFIDRYTDFAHYICENGVCKEIIKLSQHDIKDLHINIDEEIKIVEKEDNISLAKNQIEAVKEAINNGVTIITGGPGTGKTTTINTIIKRFENNDQKVVL